MKKVRILALVLALTLLAGLLAACGTSEAGDTSSNAQSGSQSGSQSGGTADGGVIDEEELIPLKMYMFASEDRMDDAHEEKLEAAINAIAGPEAGVEIDIVMFAIGDYMTKAPLELAGGSGADLIIVGPMQGINLSTLYSASYLMDISPYLEEYGTNITSILGDYLNAVTINGGVYMVPNYRNYASSVYICWNKAWIDELDLADAVQNMSSWEEFEQVVAALAEAYGVTPIASRGSNEDSRILCHGTAGSTFSGTGSFDNALVTDAVGDTLYALITDSDTDTVSCLYDEEIFVQACQKAKEWFDKGWIYEDASFTDLSQEDQILNEVAACFLVTSELGVEIAKQTATKHELYATKVVSTAVCSSVVSRFGLAVNSVCEEPEAAVRFMDLLISNGELNDLFNWGLEGEDWQKLDSGEIGYVEGYQYHGADYLVGNAFLSQVWEGNGADYRERCREEMQAAPVSKYLGFSLESSKLDNTVAALTAVQEEFLPSITTGLYTDEMYQNFLSKLDAAGIDDYIAEAQTQLDAWLAAK